MNDQFISAAYDQGHKLFQDKTETEKRFDEVFPGKENIFSECENLPPRE